MVISVIAIGILFRWRQRRMFVISAVVVARSYDGDQRLAARNQFLLPRHGTEYSMGKGRTNCHSLIAFGR
jgi:hypothetical protein